MSAYVDEQAIEAHIAEVIPLRGVRDVAEDYLDPAGGITAPAGTLTSSNEIPAHLLEVPGLVGHIANWITATALYPQPPLALGAALTLVGTAAGRKYAGPTKSGTHLYTLAIAPTGAGKNHAPKMVKRLMLAANMKELIGPGQFMSEPAVYQQVSARPLMLCMMDEFGSYLQRINNKNSSGYEKGISGVLRSLWGASFEMVSPPAWAKSSSRDELKPIHAPSLSIYGMSVPDEFYAALQSADIANGFLNRFLIFTTVHKPEEVQPTHDEDVVPPKLVDWLQRIAEPISRPGTISDAFGWKAEIRLDFAPPGDARLHYKAFRSAINDRGDDAKLLSRVPELAIRLASIRAIGQVKDGTAPVTVSLDDMRWGCELALWSAERMAADANAYMVESDHQARAKEILRYIREAKSGRISRTVLSSKVKFKFDARVLGMVLDNLEEAGEIERERVRIGDAKKPTEVIQFIGRRTGD